LKTHIVEGEEAAIFSKTFRNDSEFANTFKKFSLKFPKTIEQRRNYQLFKTIRLLSFALSITRFR
jgi:hypothetical protein